MSRKYLRWLHVSLPVPVKCGTFRRYSASLQPAGFSSRKQTPLKDGLVSILSQVLLAYLCPSLLMLGQPIYSTYCKYKSRNSWEPACQLSFSHCFLCPHIAIYFNERGTGFPHTDPSVKERLTNVLLWWWKLCLKNMTAVMTRLLSCCLPEGAGLATVKLCWYCLLQGARLAIVISSWCCLPGNERWGEIVCSCRGSAQGKSGQ